MAQFLLVLVVALTVGAVVFGVSVLVTGADQGLGAAEPDGRAVPLPGTRPLVEEDVQRVRFDLALRGYRMAQVDQAMRRAAYDIGYKDELISVLEAEVEALRDGRTADANVLRRAREAALLAATEAAIESAADDPTESADPDSADPHPADLDSSAVAIAGAVATDAAGVGEDTTEDTTEAFAAVGAVAEPVPGALYGTAGPAHSAESTDPIGDAAAREGAAGAVADTNQAADDPALAAPDIDGGRDTARQSAAETTPRTDAPSTEALPGEQAPEGGPAEDAGTLADPIAEPPAAEPPAAERPGGARNNGDRSADRVPDARTDGERRDGGAADRELLSGGEESATGATAAGR